MKVSSRYLCCGETSGKVRLLGHVKALFSHCNNQLIACCELLLVMTGKESLGSLIVMLEILALM